MNNIEQKIISLYVGYEQSTLSKLNREGWRVVSISGDFAHNKLYALIERDIRSQLEKDLHDLT